MLKKRLICVVLALALIIPTLCVSASALTNMLYATDNLNLRSTASSSGTVLRTLAANEKVILLADSTNGWAKVKTQDELTGYCSTRYLQKSNNSLATVKGKTTASVNLRSGPGTDHSVLTTLNSSTTVNVLDNSNEDWAKVKSGTYTGYISKDYLTIVLYAGNENVDTDNLPVKDDNTQKNQTKFYLPYSEITLDVGEEFTLTSFVDSSNNAIFDVSYSVDNSSVLSVSGTGVLKALSAGKAVVSVKNTNTNQTEKVTVTVNASSVTPTQAPIQKPTQPPTEKPTQAPTQPPTQKPTQVPTQAPTAPITETLTISATKATVYTGNYYQLKATSNVSVTWTSSNNSVATVSNGIVTTIKAGTVKITAKTSTKSAVCTVTVKDGTAVKISHKSATAYVGKTFMATSSTSGVKWKSHNTSVATVNKGYILGVKAGTAVIEAYTSSGAATCLVTVKDALPVKFAYTSPNSASKNSTVKFIAVTDKKRTKVKFEYTINGTTKTVETSSKKSEGNTYVWTASAKLATAGTYNVTAYSYYNSKWSTTSDGKTTAFVTASSNLSTPVCEQRRASDKLINLIANFEGYMSEVYDDPLTGDPTLGYGKVVWSGDSFYNNLTKTEAYAYLAQTVNNEGYTKDTNKFLINNKVKFNQQQFDALVCFAYNTGTGVFTNDSEINKALLNCYEPSSSGSKSYFINAYDVNFRKGPGTGYGVIKVLSYGTALTLKSTSNKEWYQVALSDGTTGYVYSEYVGSKTVSGARNLNYVDKQYFINKFCQYHHAGGSCVWGLLYRRVDEMEMFFYGDYDRNYGVYKYDISFTCANNSSFHT